ncbi:MAG: AAA family ATPase [Vicinamibacterales bacterium]
MNSELRQIVEARLKSEGLLQKDLGGAVLAACDGAEALAKYLADGQHEAVASAGVKAKKHPGAYLTKLTVEGFRGIGEARTLDLTPGPGLTLVVGRNGSGKSSFAEALELLFTGDSRRWAGRPKIWKDGWRSLHHSHPTTIEAHLLLEGQGPLKVSAAWGDGAALEDGKTTVQPTGKTKTSLKALGWTDALASHRPFLSYNELGSMLDEGPSKLYDALSTVLGLEDLVQAQDALAKARLDRTKAFGAVDAAREGLGSQLRALLERQEDDRAKKCLDALTGKNWDLDVVAGVLAGASSEADALDVTILARAASLEAPDEARVQEVATKLRAAHERVEQVVRSDAERSRRLALLLESALTLHTAHGGDVCPVCKTPEALGPAWANQTREEVARLKGLAAASEQAHGAADKARSEALALLTKPPALLDQLFNVGVDGLPEVREAWARWHSGAALKDLTALASHLTGNVDALIGAIEQLKKTAVEEHRKREDVWKPFATALSGWLVSARDAKKGQADKVTIQAAEDWMKKAAGEIRDQRFGPIADQAMATWAFLRQNSNVELGRIELEGSGIKRRVTLDVTVDGVAGAALGVMSQGELHSLALSLFLPRATLPESPFRFIVIDDPVQSMDPSRVDGLARALEEIARTRQVVVFSHDERLPEGVRRLNIKSTILSVTRRPKSTVEVRTSLDPVRAHIEDALALVHTTDLPKDILQRLVPGFCRSALEASFIDVIRRRGLEKGRAHEEIEDAVKQAGKLTPLAALAFYDDRDRGGDVMGRLNKIGGWAGDAFKECNKGAHDGTATSFKLLIDDTAKLADQVRLLK